MDIMVISEVECLWRETQTWNVDVCGVGVLEVEPGPPRRTGYERVLLATPYGGQRDQVLINVMFVKIVRDERGDFRRDPVTVASESLTDRTQFENFLCVSSVKSIHLGTISVSDRQQFPLRFASPQTG